MLLSQEVWLICKMHLWIHTCVTLTTVHRYAHCSQQPAAHLLRSVTAAIAITVAASPTRRQAGTTHSLAAFGQEHPDFLLAQVPTLTLKAPPSPTQQGDSGPCKDSKPRGGTLKC